jgi:adenine-specific DNA-methyltransferase
MKDTRERILDSIRQFSSGNLTGQAIALFTTLGYNTDRQAPLSSPTFQAFSDSYINGNPNFKEEKALVKEWRYVDLLFQLSDAEITKQTSLFDSKKVVASGDSAIAMHSYLFFVIELAGAQYTRTALSNITREINKLFPMPVMVLFKHGEALTLAVINRRLHKRDEGKDVLLKVTLIKDINLTTPHRAHIEILFDLSFDELLRKEKFTNFVDLHKAWEKTLDTKELNKRFFQELANWYFWAMDHVSFPDDVEKDTAIRNATNLIRLITRIIFIWFIKEKGLVPEMLFDRKELGRLLKEFAKNEGSSNYYKAILQNLFFGTLNQKMDERGFAKEGSFAENRSNYGVKNLFRYLDLFSIIEKAVLALFKDIPFLNGGLFDCLDKENDEGKVVYGDGFSRNSRKQPMVPDFLFFGTEKEYDLNKAYGTKNKRYKVHGLINLLSHYKFTITENTPIEEEVALDPELLGKVFENLLASYNPETQTTARKQTGSFYTPREIVNYMVDESLKAYLEQALSANLDISSDDAKVGLDILFAYTEKEHAFTEEEKTILIKAIDTCKILDPACGSGAFPMGVLHKMVHILHKLDPNNEQWKQRQVDKVDKLIEEAQEISDSAAREQVIAGLEQNRQDIEDAFGSNELDYGRKLYLIENCIYGVDIQPIAVQIAKLRFFISLVIDQKKQQGKENFGIRALPNLETKFVAANTLIGLERLGQGLLKNREIEKREKDLKSIRHQYFSAKTRRDKINWQKKDRALREEISKLLIHDGWDKTTAQQIVRFDPYDQNASSPFFDPEWMFSATDGFDVVIGNPPYVRADSGHDHLALRQQIIRSGHYETLWEKWDLFIPFMERSYKLLRPGGVTSLIVSDAYCHSKYAQKSQTWFLKNSQILRLDFLSKIKVFDAGVHNLTYLFKKTEGRSWKPERRIHDPAFGVVTVLPTKEQDKLDYRVFFPEESNGVKVSTSFPLLHQICYVSYGLRPSSNEDEARGEFVTADLVSQTRDSIHCKPYVEGKHLARWLPFCNLWIEWDTERAPYKFCRPTFPEMYSVPEKIIAQRSPGPDPVVCYDACQLIFTPASVGFIPWHSLSGVRNNSIKKSARYPEETPLRPDLPDRKELEETSERFALKYILAVMNSTVAHDFLRANRRSNIHLYPDDWKNLPIPDATPQEQGPIASLVDQILDIKSSNPLVDVSTLEDKVDILISNLYGRAPETVREEG